MRIEYHKHFLKQYKRLGARERLAVEGAILKFKKSILDSSLCNHPLWGDRKACRSISAGYDLRIIYYQIDDDLFMFSDVGTHSELYG